MQRMLNVKQLPLSRILLGCSLNTVESLFELVARTVAERDARLAAKIQDKLLRRHARQSTGLGAGIALPHAAVPGITFTHAVFVRSSNPIGMSAPDNRGVTDVLALLVPLPGLASDYDLLMSLTNMLTRAPVRDELPMARRATDVQALLLEQEWR